jgi:competence CoiA-like predicted nuclease
MPHEHFYMGAINKTTNEYTFPLDAHKKYHYYCPKCNHDIIFRNGKIKVPHFSHKKKSNCCYYSSPSETEIHKEAKRLVKKIIDDKCSILIYRNYNCCDKIEKVFKISNNDYSNQLCCFEEFFFNINGSNKYADVALLDGVNIKFIFEIYHTHRTSEERQNKFRWCEMHATKFMNETMNQTNINENGEIEIECVRNIKCRECVLKKYIKKIINNNQNIVCNSWNKLKNEWLDWKKKIIEYHNEMKYIQKKKYSIISDYFKKRNQEINNKKLINRFYDEKKEKEYQEKIKRLRGH